MREGKEEGKGQRIREEPVEEVRLGLDHKNVQTKEKRICDPYLGAGTSVPEGSGVQRVGSTVCTPLSHPSFPPVSTVPRRPYLRRGYRHPYLLHVLRGQETVTECSRSETDTG